jgi:hypothetical protein
MRSLLAVAPGRFVHSIKIFFALAWFTSFGLSAASAQSILGALGAESEPNRLQQWLGPRPNQRRRRTPCCSARMAPGRFRSR